MSGPCCLHFENADKKRAVTDLEGKDDGGHRRDYQPHDMARRQRAKTGGIPGIQRVGADDETRSEQGEGKYQSALQSCGRHDRTEEWIDRHDPLASAIDFCEHPELDRLEADHDCCRGVEKRIEVEGNAGDGPWLRNEPPHNRKSDCKQQSPRVEEEPARAEEQHEAEMPPAIPPAPQMRRPASTVRRQGGRHLGDPQLVRGGLHYHLAGEFHSPRLKIEAEHRVAAKTAKPAMKVAAGAAEEEAADSRQNRVAEIAMKSRHSSWRDPAQKSIPHDELVALTEALKERHQRIEVIASVAITHNHVFASGSANSPDECGAITSLADRNDTSAEHLGNGLRAVRAAIICDQHLALYAVAHQESVGRLNALAQRLRFIQARHQYCEFARRMCFRPGRTSIVHKTDLRVHLRRTVDDLILAPWHAQGEYRTVDWQGDRIVLFSAAFTFKIAIFRPSQQPIITCAAPDESEDLILMTTTQLKARELIRNRRRLSFARKASLFGIVLRENGLAWTTLLAAYYATSAVAEWSFARLQRTKAERGLPGTSSLRLNERIWTDWDWSSGGDEWTLSPEWKSSLISCVLTRYVPEGVDTLEIGPGAGRWTAVLQPRARHLFGVDISETCIDICRRKFGGSSNTTFLKSSGADLNGVPDRSIDALWSFDVFVHINRRDVEAYVREFSRVMRHGAVGVIHHGSGAGTQGGWRSDLTTADFTRLLNESGFEIVDQFERWEDNGEVYSVGLYQDVVTVFRRAA